MTDDGRTTNDTTNGDAHDHDDDKVKQKDVDVLLAKELNDLSLAERETVYEEIHGVDQAQEETLELVSSSLQAMESELNKIVKKAAYNHAYSQNPNYVTDPKFRKMFLRSENFSPTKSALKLVNFMQGKLELFGADSLTRSVYLSDLDKDDLACLKTGAYQHLPSRDSTGRAIIADFHLILKQCYKRPENLIKTLCYMQLNAAEDEETQKRGMVGIVYYVGKFNGKFNHELNKQCSALLKWLPIQSKGYHICFDDPRLRAWKPVAMLLMGKNLRIRLRIHDGTHTECRYSLMTFGVPVDVLPLTYKGELKTVNHMKWISRRQVKENCLKCTGVFTGIDLPGRKDVILRRGRIFQNHPGNVVMRTFIGTHQDAYNQAAIKDKPNIAWQIVKIIQSEGGRFLEHGTAGWWFQISDKEAVKRVGKSIRTARSSANAAQKKLIENGTATIRSGTDSNKRFRLNSDLDEKTFPCFALPCLGGAGGVDGHAIPKREVQMPL